jgi:type II secretion system protein J
MFRRRTSSCTGGFTLVELIVALSIAALLTFTLYASLHVAFRARRTAEEHVRPMRAATIAADLISQDLQCVMPPTGLLAGAFTGTQQAGAAGGARADMLDFYCVGEDFTPNQQTQPTDEGLRHVQIAIRADVDPPVLVRRVWRNLLTTTQQDPDEEIICRGVRSLQLRYFDGTTWQDAWESTSDNTLPVAVELTMDVQKDPSQASLSRPASTFNDSSDLYHITRVVPLSCAAPSTTTGGAP